MSNNYITRCHRRFELVGVSCSWSSSCSSRQWEPAPDRGFGPSGPRLSSPAEWGRSAAIVRWTWGQYVAVCSVSNSRLTHKQHRPFRNPFENKMWEVYSSKEMCSFVIIVDYVYAYICIRIVVWRLYKCILQPQVKEWTEETCDRSLCKLQERIWTQLVIFWMKTLFFKYKRVE